MSAFEIVGTTLTKYTGISTDYVVNVLADDGGDDYLKRLLGIE